jgi:hypothetical protein
MKPTGGAIGAGRVLELATLHHVQIVDLSDVDRRESGRQQVRLLLVVALETDAIARPDHGLQKRGGVARLDDLSLREYCPGAPSGSRAICPCCQLTIRAPSPWVSWAGFGCVYVAL